MLPDLFPGFHTSSNIKYLTFGNLKLLDITLCLLLNQVIKYIIIQHKAQNYCSPLTVQNTKNVYTIILQYYTILYNILYTNIVQIQYIIIQCNTTQNCSIQYNAVLYFAILCNKIQHNTNLHWTRQYCVIVLYDTVLYITTQYNTVQLNANTLQQT